jgi:prephenate dehydrogenase
LKKVGIVGMGVMGGSLLLALKENESFESSVYCHVRKEASKEWCLENGATKAIFDIKEFPSDLDFIFLATPVDCLENIAKEIGYIESTALISDLASTKAELIPNIVKNLKGKKFLSCHPMCGSEKSGYEGSDINLYKNKTVVLTPHNENSENHLKELGEFWENLGSKTLTLSPEIHDDAVAWVSHMPHVLMYSLIQAISIAERDTPEIFKVAGTGLKDLSRLAASNPSLWTQIILENKNSVLQAITGIQSELDKVQKILNSHDSENDLFQYLVNARQLVEEKGLNKKHQ